MNGGAYAHVRRRRITGPRSSKDDWCVIGRFNWLTIASSNQAETSSTSKGDQPSTPKGSIEGPNKY